MLGLCFEGAITEADLRTLRGATASVMHELGRCFMLADMSLCTGIDAAARKYMADWSRESVDVVAGTAVYGMSFATRAITMLAINAIKLLAQKQVDVVFLKEEVEARRWVDEQRSARFPERDHVGE